MTVEFYKNQENAWNHMDQYGYNPKDSLLIKVRWNDELDRSGGRPMDIDSKKVKTGTVGYITGSKDEPYTIKEAIKYGFDAISEVKYPKGRTPIFHKGMVVTTHAAIIEQTKKREEIKGGFTGTVMGPSKLFGHIKVRLHNSPYEGETAHMFALSLTVVGCPDGEVLRKGKCVKK